MAHFFVKLIPLRPTFPFDMSGEERAVMLEHREHMDKLFAEGKCLIFGPVLDPEGAYGMGVFEIADQAAAEAEMRDDPSIVSGLNRLLIYPMRIGGAQASREA